MCPKNCVVLLLTCVAASAQDAPKRPTFEVASIKPAAPKDDQMPDNIRRMMRTRMDSSRAPGWLPMDKGRVTLRDWTLTHMVAAAYRVRTSQVSGPAWMEDVTFDVEAKIP